MLRVLYGAILLSALSLLIPAVPFAGTGILEIHSEPSGAHISIDDVDAGMTPYQNLEEPSGKHRVKAVFSPEYPPQVQDVLIDERFPQVVQFKFLEKSSGRFVGQEIVRTVSKYKGNVTFASIPTGALVVINGEPLKRPAPIGYSDVEVGKYAVEFRSEGKVLRTDFDVIQGETVKLVADFRAGKITNSREQARLKQETVREQEAAKQKAGKEKVEAKPQEVKLQDGKQQEAKLQEAAVPQMQPSVQPAVLSKPKPAEGVPPYGELVITMNVLRDAGIKYSDFFSISFPRLPIDSLSGPVFPSGSAMNESAFKDNFEYVNDAGSNTRRFSARIDFERVRGRTERRAGSSVMTLREGTYDLKITRMRLADHFYTVQKVLDETDQEALEIIRGNRLIVQIDSHIDAENNKIGYEIKRSYEDLVKKKTSGKQTVAAETTPKTSPHEVDYRSLPIFGGQN